jgi:hypothetical protein
MAVAGGRISRGQEAAEIDPTGGLRSRGLGAQGPAIGISREELVRQWDLDGNGTIDASEAAVAKARMRRSRRDMELGTSIDPVTGKPRVAVEESLDEADDLPPEPGIDESPEHRPRAADAVAPPGTRVPEVKPVASGTAGLSVPRITSSGSAPSSGARAGSRPSPAWSRPGSLTGGVRAGAPPARTGYGQFAPKPDLNAGLPAPRTMNGRPVLSGTRGFVPRGGFLPTMRSPLMPRPSATPSLVPATPSRVMADDIGGY